MNNEQLYAEINALLRTELPTIGEYKDEGETIHNCQKWHPFEIRRGNDRARLSVTVWKLGFEVDRPSLRASFYQLDLKQLHSELMSIIASTYKFEPDGSRYQTPDQFNMYDSFQLTCSSLDDAHRILSAVRDYFRVVSYEQLADLEEANRERIKQLAEELDQTRAGFYNGLEQLVKGE